MAFNRFPWARVPKVVFLFLVPILFSLSAFPAVAEDSDKLPEDIRVEDVCAAPVGADFSGGFDPSDFEMVNVTVDPDSGHMIVGNDAAAMSPGKVTLAFTQDVYATFLSEGTSAVSDLGWVLYDDAVDDSGVFFGWDSVPSDKKHAVFHRMVDDTENYGAGDGILDVDYGKSRFPVDNEAELAVYDDGTGSFFAVDSDGKVTARDMKKRLGRFAAGSEIVFFLAADRKWDSAGANEVFFNNSWGPDLYDACVPDSGSPLWIDAANGIFEKVFHVEDPAMADTCRAETNWLDEMLLDRLGVEFDLHLSGERSLEIKAGEPYPHLLGSARAGDASQWVMGFEDKDASSGGADMDYNDLVFLIDPLNGGTARLDPSKAIIPDEESARFTGVEISVCDVQPTDTCAGNAALEYFVSPDQGANWIEVTKWDSVHSFEFDPVGEVIRGDQIDPVKWKPGTPPSTCRRRWVDLIDHGITGNRLLWKVEIRGTAAGRSSEVVEVQLNAAAAVNKTLQKASPVIQANLLYETAVETPADSWTDQGLRGHVTARSIYDAAAPDQTFKEEMPLWNAGEVLSAMNPDERRIYFPDLDVRRMENEYLVDEKGERIYGDGTTDTFTGILAHSPALPTTVRIYDGRPEVFVESGTAVLKGSRGGKGVINRFSGRWQVTFNRPPAIGVPIMASYSWYTSGRILKAFTPAEVTNDMLGLSDELIWPDGFTHDFNRDGNFDASESRSDAIWLTNWVRGYRRPESGVKKEWPLGPVNHSTPALMVPPGYPRWLHGIDVTTAERDGFAVFQKAHRTRRSILLVGSGSGLLHAFDAGAFRHGDNPETPGITENRGYFQWQPKTDGSPPYCDRIDGTKCPDYGTGRELWAFIPGSQMPLLKNTFMTGGNHAQVNTPPALSDVRIDTDSDGNADSWRTIVVTMSGSGGGSIFCLDVTDAREPAFLWEFNAPDLARDFSAETGVRIGRIRDFLLGESRWVVFVSTGRLPEVDSFPAVYLLDASDGRILEKVVLEDAIDLNGNGTIERDEADYGRAGVLGGHPAIVDSNDNGFVDRLYVGSDRGLVYKVNIPDHSETAGVLTHCILNTDFTDSDGAGLPPKFRLQGIYTTPTVDVVHDSGEEGNLVSRTRVTFGTGVDFSENSDVDAAISRNHVLSYIDLNQGGDCDQNQHALDWFYELEENQSVRADIFSAAGRLYIGTATTDVEDPCAAMRKQNDEPGLLTVMDLEGVAYMSRRMGNVHFAPLVEDRHVYLMTPTGLQSLGCGIYNNELQSFGVPEIRKRSWEEVE
ncbi:MAG: hypothetical protein WAK95_13850 [Desulfobacterales bacterium]